MDALAHTRWMKASLLVLVVPAITASFVNAWGNYQQEEFEKMLKGKVSTRKGEVKLQRTRRSYRPPSCLLTKQVIAALDHWTNET